MLLTSIMPSYIQIYQYKLSWFNALDDYCNQGLVVCGSNTRTKKNKCRTADMIIYYFDNGSKLIINLLIFGRNSTSDTEVKHVVQP